jgi:hypothetical protein
MERIELDPEKRPVLTKAQLVKLFANSPKRVDRMLAATRSGDPWLEFFSNAEGLPGKTTSVTTRSAESALNRIMSGEEPPLMPSEKKGRLPAPQTRKPQTMEAAIGEVAFKIARTLPGSVEAVHINNSLKMVSINFADGGSSFLRKQVSKPGRKMNFSIVSFVPAKKSPSVPPA